MPLLFSYGSLQETDVQLSTFGRLLAGHTDELLRCEPSLVPIDDPDVAARLGKTHHANVTFNTDDASRVPGVVFEVTDAELAKVDDYEAAFSYERVTATLASGRDAFVYVHTPAPRAHPAQ
jgi:Gamma-glutamyl cyclotransferase, AIG2-like